MKSLPAFVAVAFLLGGVADAQTKSTESLGYLEGVGQSAFGNVTSQSFGGEVGVTVLPAVQVFLEAGKVMDAATSDLGPNAQLIAGFLSLTQSGVTYQVREPVTFGVAGVRYLIPWSSRVQPYVLGGAGVAKVSKNVSFTVGGNNANANLGSYGVVLGSDLSGSLTKPLVSFGGGVVWPAWERLIVDFQYRYGRVLISGQGINLNRAGLGLGVRF